MRHASQGDSGGDCLQNQIGASRTNIFERNRDQPSPGICKKELWEVSTTARLFRRRI
jgi:hypothetical protein